ncbi:unnamed protein product [Ambrosiozyma monospora]|uniref:Unnamed protein product n=1 Tax=Ambrosiozyma monospora TaxID=43982 RepID=A0ACB5T2F0_AMBMO|nr:unnamed protein product [Ambrosiozyma monospora]
MSDIFNGILQGLPSEIQILMLSDALADYIDSITNEYPYWDGRKLHLQNCVLSSRCLDSFPNQLIDLKLDLVVSDFHSRYKGSKLPKRLQTLQLTGCANDVGFVRTLNVGYLDKLNSLSFTLPKFADAGYSRSHQNFENTKSQLKSLVHSFPPNIKPLNFEHVPAELLAHNTLPFVEDFIFSSFGNYNKVLNDQIYIKSKLNELKMEINCKNSSSISLDQNKLNRVVDYVLSNRVM